MTTIVSGSSITFNDNTTQNTSAYGGGFALRNRIINGDCRIDQRNAGASVTPTLDTTYTLDRWAAGLSAASKYSIQQNAGAVTPPAGFTNYLGVTSTSAYSVSASDYFYINQRIEGYNVSDLAYGTASAKTVTLSFWVRSSLTGTFGGSLYNATGNYSYPFSYTISTANTWEQKSITIAGDTAHALATTNGLGILVAFGLGVGSTYSATSGSWQSGLLLSTTGATSVVGTNGATFYITGVQLEKGSTATSFDYRPYGQELALCQRYYQVVGGANLSFYTEQYISGNSIYLTGNGYFKVNMRSAPTVTLSGAYTTVNMTGSPTYITNDNNFNAYWQGGASAGRALFHLNNGATLNFTSEL